MSTALTAPPARPGSASTGAGSIIPLVAATSGLTAALDTECCGSSHQAAGGTLLWRLGGAFGLTEEASSHRQSQTTGTTYHHPALPLIGYPLVLYSLICSQVDGQTADQPEVRDLPIRPGLVFTMGAALAGHAQVP